MPPPRVRGFRTDLGEAAIAALLSYGVAVQTEHKRLKEKDRTDTRRAQKWDEDEATRLQQAAKGWDKFHNYPACRGWIPSGPNDRLEDHPEIHLQLAHCEWIASLIACRLTANGLSP